MLIHGYSSILFSILREIGSFVQEALAVCKMRLEQYFDVDVTVEAVSWAAV